jgi:hypothetical protein
MTRGSLVTPAWFVLGFCGWMDGLQLWRVAANTLNKQPQTNDKGRSSMLEVGRGANNPHTVKK